MKAIAYLAFGITVGMFIGWSATMVDYQTAWQEGRMDVLETTVQVGGEESPCSVKIPLSVLAEMVNSGVMDWHRVCKGDTND